MSIHALLMRCMRVVHTFWFVDFGYMCRYCWKRVLVQDNCKDWAFIKRPWYLALCNAVVKMILLHILIYVIFRCIGMCIRLDNWWKHVFYLMLKLCIFYTLLLCFSYVIVYTYELYLLDNISPLLRWDLSWYLLSNMLVVLIFHFCRFLCRYWAWH